MSVMAIFARADIPMLLIPFLFLKKLFICQMMKLLTLPLMNQLINQLGKIKTMDLLERTNIKNFEGSYLVVLALELILLILWLNSLKVINILKFTNPIGKLS